MNSQEFKFQKKYSSHVPIKQEQPAKVKKEEVNLSKSPMKKFKSLQEALEYNQNTVQETTLSAKAAKGTAADAESVLAAKIAKLAGQMMAEETAARSAAKD